MSSATAETHFAPHRGASEGGDQGLFAPRAARHHLGLPLLLLALLAGCDAEVIPRAQYADSGVESDVWPAQPAKPDAFPAQPAKPDQPKGCAAVTDVPNTHPYRTAICWAVEKQIIEAPGGLFNPDGSLQRRLMAKHLVLIKHGATFTPPTTPIFTDVSASDPDFRFIQMLGADGITVGCTLSGPKKFCPQELGSNAHAASFGVRARHGDAFTVASQQPYFADVAATHWGFLTVQRLEEDKAAISCSTQRYCPDSPITRGRWAAVLYSYFGK